MDARLALDDLVLRDDLTSRRVDLGARTRALLKADLAARRRTAFSPHGLRTAEHTLCGTTKQSCHIVEKQSCHIATK